MATSERCVGLFSLIFILKCLSKFNLIRIHSKVKKTVVSLLKLPTIFHVSETLREDSIMGGPRGH